MATTTTHEIAASKKSGIGKQHGVFSELTAFLRVRPGQTEELRAACERFEKNLKAAPRKTIESFGLSYTRLAIFDNGTRLMWITCFETDWDPYIDDSVNTFGIKTWTDWLRHTEEFPDDVDTLSSAELKKLIQSTQVPATGFFQAIPDLTMPQIEKGQRVVKALEAVADNPEGLKALKQPALEPLLNEAAD
jgi:hypothetical protein